MIGFLVFLSVVAVLGSVLLLNEATLGVGVLLFACWCLLLARLEQERRHELERRTGKTYADLTRNQYGLEPDHVAPPKPPRDPDVAHPAVG